GTVELAAGVFYSGLRTSLERCALWRKAAGGSTNRKLRDRPAPTPFVLSCGVRTCIMASSGVGVNSVGSANEAPEIPDNVGDWLRGVYRFATDRNDFRRNLILNLGLFAAGVWLARNLSDIDLMAPQP
ncbi:LOW QUALITY PROTEIN: Mitochondrial import receptor subunit TOM6, partial [Galemys pyrenaicus]